MTALTAARTAPGWFTADDCRLADFRAVVETTTDLADYPHADEVRENVLVYGPAVREHTATAAGGRGGQGRAPPGPPPRAGHGRPPRPPPPPRPRAPAP